MFRPLRMFLQIVAVLQLVHIAASEGTCKEDENKSALDAQQRYIFFQEFCRFGKDLHIQRLESQLRLKEQQPKENKQASGSWQSQNGEATSSEECQQQIRELNSKLISKDNLIRNLTLTIEGFYEEQDEVFLEASNSGDFELVRKLVNSGVVNLNVQGDESNTALINTAINNHSKIVEFLIEAGADLNAKNIFNSTALTWAAHNNHTAICKILLQAGADVNIKNQHGDTALTYAVWRNNIEIVQILINKGAKVDSVTNNGHTGLHLAAMRGNVQIVSLLLKNGADVNFSKNNGYTPLHKAAGWGHVNVAKILVRHGANINAKARDGITPLDHAISDNQTAMVRYLKSIGATT